MRSFIILTAAVALVSGCVTDGLVEGNFEAASKDIGTGGGEVRAAGVRVVVPDGALSQTTRITIAKATEGNPDSYFGAPVDLGPDGIQFAKPVELVFPFDKNSLPDPSLPDLVRIATVVNGDWQPLDAVSVDAAAGTVQGSVTHFSRWGTIQICGNARQCPTGQVCVKHRCVALEVCDDGLDNDKDGLVDCADPDCGPSLACARVCCFDTIAMRCVSSCCQNNACIGNCYCGSGWCSRCAGGGTETDCANGLDDDKDGFIDCRDPDCAKDPSCTPTEICNNGVDDDGDGAVDCADSDCASDPAACPTCCILSGITVSCEKSCPAGCTGGSCSCKCGPELCSQWPCSPIKEVCNNGVDDDRDGAVDCADTDCVQDPACTPPASESNCTDGIDNDRDGLVDCKDPDCGRDPTCTSCGKCMSDADCAVGYVCTAPTQCLPSCTCLQCTVCAGNCVQATAKWYYTCGDPVCQGYTGGSGAPKCTTQKAGDPCTTVGDKCDPGDACNRLLQCATSDPTNGGMCPISRRSAKHDIHYLEGGDLGRYYDEVKRIKLATWRYNWEPKRARLGFIIDDNPESASVDPKRDMVDLYGYTSLAVAAVQAQAREIEALKKELAAVRRGLAARPCDRAPSGGR